MCCALLRNRRTPKQIKALLLGCFCALPLWLFAATTSESPTPAADTLQEAPPLEPTVSVDNAFIRGLPPGQANTSAYFHLRNQSDVPLRLIGASTNIARLVEIHEHRMNNGKMQMRKVDGITIDASSEVELKPGGLHLMLFDLNRPLVDGESISVQLIFQDSPQLDLTMTVRSVLKEP